MRKIIVITISLLQSHFLFSQPPVTWKITTAAGRLIVTGIPAKGWYVYDDTTQGLSRIGLKEVSPEGGKDSGNTTIIKDPVFNNTRVRVFEKEFTLERTFRKLPGQITITGFASDGTRFIPIDTILEIFSTVHAGGTHISIYNTAHPISRCGDEQITANKSLLAIFMLGLAGGLLALFTPCVFPMIPATVSFFGSSKSKGPANGILYGLSILTIYLLASVPFHLMDRINPQVFNLIATSAGVNLAFFIIFVLFALSFFGLFEIGLPSFVANSTGNKGGIFFMALTLAVVSFSCTGPILGSLLVGSLSSSGGAWELTAGMAGFGLALALPFSLFAMFPGWLKILPKSGSWMGVFKKSLAFIELGLAVKFLSNADLVYHWGILKREVFIGTWILISLLLSLYLFGVMEPKKFPGMYVVGTKRPPRFTFRSFAGLLTLLFTLYLLPGLTNTSYANLKLLSGFPPPVSYSMYPQKRGKSDGVVINDYRMALQLARQYRKPVLIDFTGWACVNCRKMEEQVWTDPTVRDMIKNKYILLSLYVDDRKPLPGPEQTKEIRTVGDKWADFESRNFGQVSQPLYVIVSPDERLINNPVGYTPSVKDYQAWLACGLSTFSGSF